MLYKITIVLINIVLGDQHNSGTHQWKHLVHRWFKKVCRNVHIGTGSTTALTILQSMTAKSNLTLECHKMLNILLRKKLWSCSGPLDTGESGAKKKQTIWQGWDRGSQSFWLFGWNNKAHSLWLDASGKHEKADLKDGFHQRAWL